MVEATFSTYVKKEKDRGGSLRSNISGKGVRKGLFEWERL